MTTAVHSTSLSAFARHPQYQGNMHQQIASFQLLSHASNALGGPQPARSQKKNVIQQKGERDTHKSTLKVSSLSHINSGPTSRQRRIVTSDICVNISKLIGYLGAVSCRQEEVMPLVSVRRPDIRLVQNIMHSCRIRAICCQQVQYSNCEDTLHGVVPALHRLQFLSPMNAWELGPSFVAHHPAWRRHET